MKQNIFFQALAGSIVLSVLFWGINLILGVSDPMVYDWKTLPANFLVCWVIAWYARKSTLAKTALMLTVFLIYFMIGHFNILIEAYIFNVTDRGQTLLEIVRGFLVVGVFSFAFIQFFYAGTETIKQAFVPIHWLSWTWRIILGDFLYLFLYAMAGFALVTVYPQLLEFYEGKIPPFELAVKTQLFLRGFIFMSIAIVIFRTAKASKLSKALLIGLAFSVFGGIAPLIQSNELMPAYVRYGHLVEVGISNFVYGFSLAYLLGQTLLSEKGELSKKHAMDVDKKLENEIH